MVQFKSTTVSYKNHTVVWNDDEGNYTEDLIKVYEIKDEVEITFAKKELFDSSFIDVVTIPGEKL